MGVKLVFQQSLKSRPYDFDGNVKSMQITTLRGQQGASPKVLSRSGRSGALLEFVFLAKLVVLHVRMQMLKICFYFFNV